MKTKTLIAALNKAGFEVQKTNNNRFFVMGANKNDGGFIDQDGNVSILYYKTKNAESDIRSDYFVNSYVNTIKGFIFYMKQ